MPSEPVTSRIYNPPQSAACVHKGLEIGVHGDFLYRLLQWARLFPLFGAESQHNIGGIFDPLSLRVRPAPPFHDISFGVDLSRRQSFASSPHLLHPCLGPANLVPTSSPRRMASSPSPNCGRGSASSSLTRSSVFCMISQPFWSPKHIRGICSLPTRSAWQYSILRPRCTYLSQSFPLWMITMPRTRESFLAQLKRAKCPNTVCTWR